MAEKYQQISPPALVNGHARSDVESTNIDTKELKRKKRIKLAIYIAIFTVSQIIVITAFVLVVMRAKSPKLRLSDKFEFKTLTTNSSPSSPSFDMTFTTQVRVKNTNWGPYKFDNTTATFTYDGEPVGEVVIPKGKAGMRSTKKVTVSVSLSSTNLRNTAKLGSELNRGILTLGSTAKMTGKVKLIFFMKKKKSAKMHCSITLDLPNQTVRTLEC
ncbi:hypothetical protein TIFTF001_003433 [Ficus carica]|uniref:Late embryogenesis abundant protein LEA-2 subgroup domain-containing protein n=1 Tax=Ficus carica TaxID=3494 RepID=A0AA87ZFT1_FICCA|nr:hypothetical protein TIFTF001_003433 [Ficus carica]